MADSISGQHPKRKKAPIKPSTPRQPRRIGEDQLQETVKKWPDHSNTALYVYRVKPPIDMKQIGKQFSYIEKIQAPFPSDLRLYIQSQHAGGVYKLDFTDSNLENTRITSSIIEIDRIQYEPILDPRTLVRGDEENERLILKWQQEGKVKIVNGIVHPASGVADVQTAKIDEALEKMKQLETQRAENNAVETTTTMAGLMAKMMDKITAPTPTNNGEAGVLAIMGNMMMALMQQNTALIQQMSTANKSQGDPLALMERTFEMMDKFKTHVEPKSEPTWKDVAMTIADNIAGPLATKFIGGTTPEASLKTDDEVEDAAESMPAPAAKPATLPPPGHTDKDRAAIANIARMLDRYMERKKSGAEAAEHLSIDSGEEVMVQIRSIGIEEMRRAFLECAPDVYQRLTARANFESFFSDFMREPAQHVN